MKIVTVVGARPQFIKAAPVSRELRGRAGVRECIVHTGQHFDRNMSEVFFRQMGIPEPDHNLAVHGLPHGAMTGRMLERIEAVLLEKRPDWVLVYGDTNSTLAGALAASKLRIPIAHVEAGLRSFNRVMPEETNRILTDRLSDLLCCPTQRAVDNLLDEGFARFGSRVVRTGDVMYDAARMYAPTAEKHSDVIERHGLDDFVLATVHRQENTDDPAALRSIVEGLNRIATELRVVVPLHPRTRLALRRDGVEVRFSVIEPVGYLDNIRLLRHCRLVLTDSGGMQKEAFFFGKHCVTLREETEWVELVEHGVNALAGADAGRIYEAYRRFSGKTSDFSVELYGAGDASVRVADELLRDRAS